MPDPDPDAPGPPPTDLPFHSLYRRFRPQRFAEVRGQDHVTRPLRNAVRDDKVAHAYLFSGPRGTGKTSTARILAMALNCASPVDGEPDGICASCVDIRKGASVDVQELDAASNRRIDEMRDLLSRVALGTRGRWKVYIIDEVHQLTGDAASALLKTLEEPPGHVVFVLATTDPQKVLPTIRSRTLHFEFHLLPSDVLAPLLHDINERAGLGVPPEAIDLVVRRGHGSARDALTVLDQVAAAGGVEDEAEVVAQIVDGLADRDAGLVLTAVAEGMVAGRDARRLAVDLLDHLRNGFLATLARGLVMLPDDAVTQVAEQARRLGLATLVRAMEVIGQALADMRDSVDPRVTLEVALVRLSRADADTSPAALLERIERLERGPGRGVDSGRGLDSGRGGEPVRGGEPAGPAGLAGPSTPAGSDTPSASAVSHDVAPVSVPPPGRIPPPPPIPNRGRGATPAAPPLPVPPPPAPTATRHAPAPVPPADPPPADPPPAGQESLPLPSRDDLTTAWGDRVLRSLSARAKGYLGSGRFLAVEPDGAVYAVANQQVLGRALDSKAEAERALASHFGRPVPLKMIVDPGGPPSDAPVAADEDLGREEMGRLEDAEAVISPEQRLMEAFPGAEEVST